jgi:hypothetical protein
MRWVRGYCAPAYEWCATLDLSSKSREGIARSAAGRIQLQRRATQVSDGQSGLGFARGRTRSVITACLGAPQTYQALRSLEPLEMTGRSMRTSRSIFTYLSDEYIALNKVGKNQFWFSLNMACLFFDEIPLPSSALLSNRFLSSAWSGGGEWASQLFRSGLIRPVFMGDKRSLCDVASSMIAHGTIHHLDSDNALLRHAQAIDSADFRELWVDEAAFRRGYSVAFEQVVDHLETEGLRDINEQRVELGQLDKLHAWAKERVLSEDLRASNVHRFLDQAPHRFSPFGAKSVKLLADVTYQAVLGAHLDAACTFSRPEVDLANIVHSAMTSSGEISPSDSELHVENVQCPLPFDRLAMLPVSDVLNLRESKCFRDLRATLHDVRAGGQFSERKIRESLALCLDFLDHYSRETNANWRSSMLRDAEKHRSWTTLAFWFGAPSSITVAVIVGGKVGGWLIAGVGSALVLRHLLQRAERRSRPERYSLPQITTDHVVINPIDGSIKGTIHDGDRG